ncbi:hypothetical protein N8301_00905 [Cyclobacteriaceae bacterium]|nr:hypothetical protein [Cyclobacteriaceae bacterium]
MIGLDDNQQTRYEIFSVFRNLMNISLRGFIESSASMSNGKPTIYYGVGNEYKIKLSFQLHYYLKKIFLNIVSWIPMGGRDIKGFEG